MNSQKTSQRSRIQGSGRKPKSNAQANISGYEKRRARKAQSSSNTNDLYEHIPEKSRRSRVGLELDRDEEFDYAAIDDANEEEREKLRARLIGEIDEDEEIGSNDDDEIDSDAAFEESDEEKFAGFFSSKKSKSKATKSGAKSGVQFAEVDLNEDEDMESKRRDGGTDEEEEEGDDDEFIDLLDVLDGKGEIDVPSDVDNTSSQKRKLSLSAEEDVEGEDDQGSGGDSEEDSEEAEDSEDERMAFAPSDDEVMPEALDQLHNFVSSLDVTAKKRKAPEDDASNDHSELKSRKRRLTKERTEAGDENEFRVRSYGAKLNLEDLLAPLASQSSNLQTLKKSTKILTETGSSKAKTLSAPLPHRTQERLDRQAAYEQTKEEVDKWSETMRRIRQAEHLSFPLQAQPKGRASNLELNAKFKPTTELESAVDALLKSAKLHEEDIQETEDAMLLKDNVSVEEIAERRAELRKMRELVFRAEVKARRVRKIKSKTYRRLRRKEKERLGEKINEQEDADDEDTKLKQELGRARERATLKHKHTGKWARQMRNKEGLDENTRKDIEDMLSRGEKLRRRIKGVGSDESDEEEDDDDDDDDLDAEAGIEKIKQSAFDELHKLDDNDGVEEGEKGNGRSIFEMKFMKDAMARQALSANKEVDDFIKEMGGGIEAEGNDEAETVPEEGDPSNGVITQRTGGRVVFKPGTSTISRPLTSRESDASSVTLKSTDLPASPLPRPSSLSQRTRPGLSEPPPEDINPWLIQGSKSAIKQSKKVNEVVVSKDSKPADKSKHKLSKQKLKAQDERKKLMDDAAVEITLSNTLTASSDAVQNSKRVAVGMVEKQNTQISSDGEESDEENIELEAEEQILRNAKGKSKVKAFEQRDLVAMAFAGDNVVQSFEELKKREIASDAPREVDTTIPGWGSWAGSGLKSAPPKPARIKQIAGIDPTTRADYNKKNIIISEKRDKKAGKYLVKDLPFPYTSKAQFERSMEQPLGAEWNTRMAFQRGTLPRVVKKPGVVINPLEKYS